MSNLDNSETISLNHIIDSIWNLAKDYKTLEGFSLWTNHDFQDGDNELNSPYSDSISYTH